jgi:hypothetical protein
LVPLDPHVPCGATQCRHGRDTGALGGACLRPDIRGAGLAPGVVPAMHNDDQQC